MSRRGQGGRGDAARRGLTLIELLLSVTLFAMAMTAAVAVLGGGLRIWERARAESRSQDEALFALEAVARDLRNSSAFFGIPFAGDAEACTFALPVRAGAALPGVQRVTYRIDGTRRALLRSAVRFPSADAVHEDVVAEGVTAWRLQYRVPVDRTWAWIDKTEPATRPLAVRVAMRVGDPGSEEEVTCDVVLPVP